MASNAIKEVSERIVWMSTTSRYCRHAEVVWTVFFIQDIFILPITPQAFKIVYWLHSFTNECIDI